MSAEPVYFGPPRRCLHGILHRPTGVVRGAMLVCAPLFQDGTRLYRASWTLAEKMAAAGWGVLRFDWYGSGNSLGQSSEMDFDGLIADIGEAERFLHGHFAGDGAPMQASLLGVRSAALPLLAYAADVARSTELTLLAPQLDGRSVTDGWRMQHEAQLHLAGRYPFGDPSPRQDDLMGFSVGRQLLDAFQDQNAATMHLLPGSRIRVADWSASAPGNAAFLAARRESGCSVEMIALEPSETPLWDAPNAFESQVFPRRSIANLASVLARVAA